jgi:hypothetical protein
VIRPDGDRLVESTAFDPRRSPGQLCRTGSDRVAKLAGLVPLARIIPFRGEYYELRPDRATGPWPIYLVPTRVPVPPAYT